MAIKKKTAKRTATATTTAAHAESKSEDMLRHAYTSGLALMEFAAGVPNTTSHAVATRQERRALAHGSLKEMGMPLGNSGGATTAELGEFGASLCAEARKRLGDGVTLPPMPELPAAKPKGERKASPAPKKRAAKPTSDVVVPKASADAPIPWTPTAAAQAVKADAGKAYHDTIMNGVIAMLKVAGFDVIDLVKHALGGK